MKIKQLIIAAAATAALTSCEKVSPIGVLVSGTGVEDRVKMSATYYKEYMGEELDGESPDGDYTFLVGADSHVTTDSSRIEEMLQIGLDNEDMFYAHLGDIADTKAEYYITLDKSLKKYKEKFVEKYYERVNAYEYVRKDAPNENAYTFEEIVYPFFPVVGNHDITHNGWALWSNIFHSSFYDGYVVVEEDENGIPRLVDHFIFIDTASGTLGKEQVELLEEGILDDKYAADLGITTRNTFVFSHTNIFRPSSLQFASTFAREETFFLLDQFVDWNANIVFCGHVHKWDEQEVGGVNYITLDSMSENNNPEPGDYLLRVHCKKDGTITWERVHMSTRKK